MHIRAVFFFAVQGSRVGAVVRALASHQCDPGFILGLGVICGLSLLLVPILAPRGFSPGSPVSPSPQKPTFPNSNSIWKVFSYCKAHLIISSWKFTNLSIYLQIYLFSCSQKVTSLCVLEEFLNISSSLNQISTWNFSVWLHVNVTWQVILELAVRLNENINPLSLNSDQHQISPCNINAHSTPEVMRIEDMITQGEFSWYFYLFVTSPQYFYKKSMGTR